MKSIVLGLAITVMACGPWLSAAQPNLLNRLFDNDWECHYSRLEIFSGFARNFVVGSTSQLVPVHAACFGSVECKSKALPSEQYTTACTALSNDSCPNVTQCSTETTREDWRTSLHNHHFQSRPQEIEAGRSCRYVFDFSSMVYRVEKISGTDKIVDSMCTNLVKCDGEPEFLLSCPPAPEDRTDVATGKLGGVGNCPAVKECMQTKIELTAAR